MKIAYGDFMPDLPDFASPGLQDVSNVYPVGSGGYSPVGEFLAHTNPLPATCRGASAFIAPSGRVVFIAGTVDKLYKQDGLEWVEIGTGYATPTGGRWRFVQFGTFAIASNYFNNPVKINLETDVVSTLGGTPPKMEAMAVVSNFVVGTQTNGSVSQVAWSAENDAEFWTPAQRKSDYQDFPDGGEVTGIIGGEIGLILQRNAVRRMAYVGGNLLFRFDKISSNVGCATVHSVAQHGELAFWYSESGFKMWDGTQIKSIGFERVDSAFAGGYGVLNYSDISTAIDGQRNTVVWSVGQRMWLYNWVLDKWTKIERPAEIITSRLTRAPSLDERDPSVGTEDDLVEGEGLDPFDAARFRAGDPRFYVFSDGELGTFAGENMEAKITGRSIELVENRDARVRRVRPMTDATAGMTVRLDARQRLGDVSRRSDASTLMASGEIPVRSRGRFVKATWSINAGERWTYIRGLDATLDVAGKR